MNTNIYLNIKAKFNTCTRVDQKKSVTLFNKG